MSHHCISDFHKACDVGTGNEITLHAVFFCTIAAVSINVRHDSLKLFINFFKCPGISHGVLDHLKCGNSYAASICCFCRAVKEAVRLINFDSLGSRRHVGAFCKDTTAILRKNLSGFSSISFCVAQGRAMSHLTVHTPEQPS